MVSIGIYVVNIAFYEDSDQHFTMSVYLRQVWRDKSLSYENELEGVDSILLPDEFWHGRVWTPDTYLDNGKEVSKPFNSSKHR